MPPAAALAALATGAGGERMELSPATTEGDPMTVKLAQPAFAIDWNVERARKELRAASIELSRRGLKLAAMWAAEQLIGLVSPAATPLPPNTPLAADFSFASLSDDLAIFAKTIFDQGEYARAASFLSAPNYSATTKKADAAGAGDWVVEPPLPNLTEYGIFIRAYSLYLAGERRKEEQVVELRYVLQYC
jgi:anaphase-promoting complex subunit 8